MKKLLIIVAITLAIVFGIAPYFIGQRAETEFKNIYAQLDTMAEVNIEVTDYQRGWLSSIAVVELKLDLTELDPSVSEAVVFKIQNDISHGPFLTELDGMELGLVDIVMKLEFPELMLEEMPDFNESFNGVLSIKNRMYFDGSMKAITVMQEFTLAEDNVNLVVNPAMLEMSTSNDGKILGRGSWDGLSVTDNGSFGMTMGKMDLNFDLQAINGNIYDPSAMFTGTSAMSMVEFRVTGQELPGMIQLNQIGLNSASDIADDLMSLDINISVAEINAMGLSFTDMVANQTFSNLDVLGLQKVNQLSRQITDENMDTKLDELIDITMSMLDKKPSYELRQMGLITAQGQIGIEMVVTLDETLVDFNNPATLAQAVVADASGYVPQAFLNAMGVMPMAQPFVDQGYLLMDGENIRFEFSYEKANMLLSGKPFPPTTTSQP